MLYGATELPAARPNRGGWRAILGAALGLVVAALGLGAASDRGSQGSAALLSKGHVFLDLQDPIALSAFERSGYGFGALFGSRLGNRPSDLSVDPAFGLVVRTVSADVNALAAEMRGAGLPLTSAPTHHVGRVIDLDWLRSPYARFDLSAIVNRMDRRDFRENRDASCGEVRFVYRLAYRFGEARFPFSTSRRAERASRLPFLVNAVFDLPAPGSGGCRALAQTFVAPQDLGGEALARWLIRGPLRASDLQLRQIEVNAQVVRLPSEMEPGFGGQAIYLMRVFGVEAMVDGRPRLTVRRLENTPDVARLRGDAPLLEDLADYITANRPRIEAGIHRLPERFLADKALSYSTFGSSRAANHPFTSLFGERWPDRQLLVRLDAGTCMGCHQSNATAGFHIFGLDDPNAFPLNRVELGASPHFYADRERRRAYVEDLAAGREPRTFRPLPSAPAADWSLRGGISYRPASLGMPCDEKVEGSGSWSCEAGLSCQTILSDPRGLLHSRQCLPPDPASFAGLPCRTGVIATHRAAYRDRVTLAPEVRRSETLGANGASYSCLPPRLGVPGGLTHQTCAPGQAVKTPDVCAAGGSRQFDICVAAGDFAGCLQSSLTRALRQSCGPARYCREDYACQALPPGLAGTGSEPGTGFCSPTYLVFQLRIDGHPNPLTGP